MNFGNQVVGVSTNKFKELLDELKDLNTNNHVQWSTVSYNKLIIIEIFIERIDDSFYTRTFVKVSDVVLTNSFSLVSYFTDSLYFKKKKYYKPSNYYTWFDVSHAWSDPKW